MNEGNRGEREASDNGHIVPRKATIGLPWWHPHRKFRKMAAVAEPKEFTRSDMRLAAYAGLFDGEGCIGMYRTNANAGSRWRYVVTLRTVMTHRDTLARMCAQFGAGTLRTYGIRKGRKRCWVWFCSARREVRRILQAIHPHLDVKAHEANIALDYLLPEGLTDAQQDRLYRAMRLPKVRQRPSRSSE